ncbi:MAG TPA: hypothetical protein VF490_18065 [Chryseosolibacter sp.]
MILPAASASPIDAGGMKGAQPRYSEVLKKLLLCGIVPHHPHDR